jgi:hypothetical protein
VSEDEVHLVGRSTLVRTEHDGEGRLLVVNSVPTASFGLLTLSVYSEPARRPSAPSFSVRSLI